MAERRKIETVHAGFSKDIDALLRLDAVNQQRYRVGPGRPGPTTLSKGQIVLITEGIFVRAFTYYETFLEETFILYTREKSTRSGKSVRSYIAPRTSAHAREMLQAQMKFLEWNSVDGAIRRSETYLVGGGPLKAALAANVDRLRSMRKVRNAIAHRSVEALASYRGVVVAELRAPLLELPPPGEFLLMSDPRAPHRYFLVSYLTALKAVADAATA